AESEFHVSNSALNCMFTQGPLPRAGALSHLGIVVASTEDVLAIRRTWPDAGLITRDEIKTDCCYALQDKTSVRDPDGNEWEVFVVLEDNLPEKRSQGAACCTPAATSAESCCAVQAEPCCTS